MEERKDNFYGDDDAFYIEINDNDEGTYSSLDGGYSSFGEAENVESDTSSNANQPSQNEQTNAGNANQMPAESGSNPNAENKPQPQPPKKPVPKRPVIRVVPRQAVAARVASQNKFDWGAFLMGVGAGFMLKLIWDAMRKGKKRK